MAIDASKTALLLLDLQNEMVDPKGKVGAGGLAKIVAERRVLENARSALDAARKHKLSIAHVRLGFRSDYLDALSVAPRVAKMKPIRPRSSVRSEPSFRRLWPRRPASTSSPSNASIRSSTPA